jgi:hypothetical protein
VPNDERTLYLISFTNVLFFVSGGSQFLKDAGTLCWFSDSLLSYAARFERDPNFKHSMDNWTNLLWRSISHRHQGPKRRWSIFLTSPENLLTAGESSTSAEIEQIGCMNFQSCPQRIRLDQIRQRVLFEPLEFGPPSPLAANLSQEEIAFLIGFGFKLSFCRA